MSGTAQRQTEYVNEHELRVMGLSRSGNHALIEWLTAQADGRVVFLNCAEGKSNPFATARPLGHGRPYEASFEGFDLEAERAGRHARKDWLLVSYEDSFLAHAASTEFELHHDTWVGPSRHRRDVLVLRDPFNLFASRYRAFGPAGLSRAALRTWKQHAKQALGRVRRLPREHVVVLFNRWHVDRDYRREVAERLGLTFTDAGRMRVPTTHGGSSFDGTRYHGRADRLGVLERWRHYEEDAAFEAFFDEETEALARALFGDVRGRPSLRQAG